MTNFANRRLGTGAGACHGWRTRCGQLAWALMIWCGTIPVRRGLSGGAAGLAGLPACIEIKWETSIKCSFVLFLHVSTSYVPNESVEIQPRPTSL